MIIRQETDADIAAIDGIHVAAFGALSPGVVPVEGALVSALRSDTGWVDALSLVAERPNESSGQQSVVGHVVCTAGSIGDVASLQWLPSMAGQFAYAAPFYDI